MTSHTRYGISTLTGCEVAYHIYNRSLLTDRRRPKSSLFTIVVAIVALYLATAYTTLLTPIDILVPYSISGNELDFVAPEFWTWVSNSWHLSLSLNCAVVILIHRAQLTTCSTTLRDLTDNVTGLHRAVAILCMRESTAAN